MADKTFCCTCRSEHEVGFSVEHTKDAKMNLAFYRKAEVENQSPGVSELYFNTVKRLTEHLAVVEEGRWPWFDRWDRPSGCRRQTLVLHTPEDVRRFARGK